MIKYVILHTFEVIGELSKGNEVYILDRVNRIVCIAGELSVKKLIEILNYDNKSGRYEFWRTDLKKEEV